MRRSKWFRRGTPTLGIVVLGLLGPATPASAAGMLVVRKALPAPVEISWEASAAADEIRFRVYRGKTIRPQELIWEGPASRGRDRYRFHDLPPAVPVQYYQLRVTAGDREVVLGTIMVVDVELEPGTALIPVPAAKVCVLVGRSEVALPVRPGTFEILSPALEAPWLEPPVPPPRRAL
ncbi:MAG: hypothetical protein GY856_50755 [bacterium]|nr:hypothetical protein [bacterium]